HPGIKDLAKKGKKTVILCDDYTRPTPAHRVMPLLLDMLNEAGITDSNIRIVMALGTHRPMTEEEIIKKVGAEVYERVEVLNHDWRDEKSLVSLGKTINGTPITVNKHVVEADLKIGVGYIVPHRVSGYSGGAKIVQPGVCGGDTTGYTHWLSARFKGEEILGVAENPVRHEIEEVARRVGLDFIVNTVLNAKGEIVNVVAGDFIKAHRKGVEEAKRIYGVEIPSKAEVVVCDSHPCDADMWQAAKGIYSADLVVKRGGSIAFITPCWEGVSPEHPDVLKFGYISYSEVERLVEEGKIKDLSAAAHIVHVGRVSAEKAEVILYSEGISEEETERLNFKYAETPQKAVDEALKRQGPNSKIVVMKNAAELLPLITKS
ncbi:TPA: nickel-dependent lactate racemase, partial [Candidatus Bathyarchaeota archaeon]|nr:nickel-dependent lactate racemase [Candidatus Bathyarchaeota archaeon]